MAQFENVLQKTMKRFDASDKHYQELIGDLVNIRQKVDAHAISIKHHEVQMDQLYSMYSF